MNTTLLAVGVVGFASGIVCRFSFLWGMWLAVFIALLATIFFVSNIVQRNRAYAIIATILFSFSFGVIRAEFSIPEVPVFLSSRIGEIVTLRGTVTTDPDVRETGTRMMVRVEDTVEHAKILVAVSSYPTFSYGDVVTVTGKISYPKAFDTTGGRTFEYPGFLARDGVRVVMEQASTTKAGYDNRLSTSFLRGLFGLKHTFTEGLSRALPEPTSSLASGIVAGGKQGLGKRLLEAFTLSGLLPIVVLSGYNVMIVAGAVLVLFRRAPRRLSLLIAMFSIAAFVIAAGAGSSAVRAGIMAGLALLARATGRTYEVLRVLVLVFLVMLVLNPLYLVYDPGFGFSFAAATGLILFSPLLAERLLFIKSFFFRDIVSTTLAAQIAVLPLLLYETGMLSLVAVPANILALPAVPLAMFLSAIAGVVGALVPQLATLVGLPAYAILSYIILIAEGASALPFSTVTIDIFPFPIVILLYGIIALVFFRMKRFAPAPVGAGANQVTRV